MKQLLQWFSMGGYAFYIWPAYGLVCVILTLHFLGIKRHRNQTRKKLQRWFESNPT